MSGSPRTGGWRVALRIAARDALRHRARSILVLVMVALPVLAVTAADIAIQTQEVSGAEGLDRRIGTAAAAVGLDGGGPVRQLADPDAGYVSEGAEEPGSSAEAPGPDARSVAQALAGPGRTPPRLVAYAETEVRFRSEAGIGVAGVLGGPVADPLFRGIVDLARGAWPRADDEVVVNRAMATELGLGDDGARAAIGRDVELLPARDRGQGSSYRITGIAESGSTRSFPVVAGPGLRGVDAVPRDEGAGRGDRWLVDGPAVDWADVQRVNALGGIVTSRAVLLDPPPLSAQPTELQYDGEVDPDTVAVAVLVVVMALLELVLLAGPAFAVGARRQSRSLALLVAGGGTPAQARAVVLAGAVVLGTVAAVAGVVLGIGAGGVAVPLLQRFADTPFGPFEVPWLHLVGIAVFGLVSAVLAAVVPAWIASRQDVVAVLGGRRGDRRPTLRSPLAGLVLLALGVGGSAYGALHGGAITIAASAIPAVLGMVLLVPLVLVGVARLGRWLPLSLRYAVRDAARHRSRTTPAVAAVAATVAGVTALGIGATSDAAQSRAEYQPSASPGAGIVQLYDVGGGRAPAAAWAGARAFLAEQLPTGTVTAVRGLMTGPDDYLEVRRASSGRDATTELDEDPLLGGSSSLATYGSPVLVADRLPPGFLGVDTDQARQVDAGLEAGRPVVFADPDAPEIGDATAPVQVVRTTYDEGTGEESTETGDLQAVVVPVEDGLVAASAVLPPRAARGLGPVAAVGTVGLEVTGASITEDEESRLQQGLTAQLAAAGLDSSLYVERGYQADDATVVVQLVLFVLGAVLVLGGTLTATFLALADARPDLATLSAVGAAPRTRRRIAAAYAGVMGLVGGLLGAAVGFVPGIAVTYPLTGGWSGDGAHRYSSGPGLVTGVGAPHYLDVPWLLVGALVLLLPLVVAGIVAATARGRLPLTSRLG